MNIKRLTAMLAAITMLTAVFTACSGGSDKSSSEKSSSQAEKATAASTEPEINTAARSIKWFGSYDINPVGGDDRSVALTLFEDYYGGTVEWIPTTNDTKYDDLSKLILGGEKVDMCMYDEETAVKGIFEKLYQPLDSYIDLDDELWAGMKSVADKMTYKGEHYIVPYSIEDPICLIYSRKIMKENKLTDPYELYKQGKWDWDMFMKMIEKFVTNTDGRGCTGWLGQALVQSTGKTLVNYDGTKFSNNLTDPDIEKAEKLLESISAGGYFNDSWQTYFPENGETLFYAMAPWALKESNAMNADKDIFIVPFPKMPGADKQYVSCSYGAKMLAAGSEKGEAVAKYIEFERMAVTDETYKGLLKELALTPELNIAGEKTGFITEEQYNVIQEVTDPSKVEPVFDFGFGMGKKMSGTSIDYESRGAMRNLTDALITGYDGSPSSWEELRDSYTKIVDEEIAKGNS